ncbi:MAG: tRNA lysidine(34) synthetase TilS [Pyrinomonadaceae bacterium]
MHGFVRNLITEWRRLDQPFSGETVIVAVSGGADSVSLLLAMHDLLVRDKLKLRIVAAHFNHRLRDGESDADEEFVRALTSERGIEFAVGHAGPLGEGNIEQNARHSRYEFLSRTAKNVDAFAILTGHTVNDQAETFLMNLIRGSGIDGLGGMKAIRSLEADTQGDNTEASESVSPSPLLPHFSASPLLLVRPMLAWAKRLDTEGFCQDVGVDYRYDTMNEDTAFRRVRIRKILLPLLEDFNPKIIETLAQTAALMQAAAGVKASRNQTPPSDELVLAEIKALPQPDLYDRVRAWLKRHRGTTRQLQLKHIEAVARLILSTKSGNTVELPGGCKVVKSAGKLVYEANRVEN